jgi:ethanolamine utilization protein EutM
MQALGLIETRGMVAAAEAADSALKAASVSLIGQKRAGSGLVMIVLTGDVAAVKAAVEAGAGSAAAIGEVVAAEVIARPHESMSVLIDEEPSEKGGGKKGGATPKASKKVSTAQTKKSPGV